MAEREGFEPSIRFCRILTFQASAFDHSATAPHAGRWRLAGPAGFRKRRGCGTLGAMEIADRPPRGYRRLAPALTALAGAVALAVAPAEAGQAPAAQTPGAIVAAAPAEAWQAIAPEDLLVMDLAPDARRRPRRIVFQLIPDPISAPWTANIRKLAQAHWWDGTSVNRVQDNYVVQWGDATEKKPLPAGLAPTNENDYVVRRELGTLRNPVTQALGRGQDIRRYAAFYKGFPIRIEGTPDSATSWPLHCYGMVGVGRNVSPDAGTGAELYVVIGQAPHQLDRNIALVGRVIAGIEHLTSLPRGTAELGFYATAAERVPIRSVRLASEMPEPARPRYAFLSPDHPSFAAYARARANRRDDFFIRPAGELDICNLPVPVRALG